MPILPHPLPERPTWKDEACREHDLAYLELREALVRYSAACADLEYGVENAGELVPDDAARYTGDRRGRVDDVTEDPGLRARIRLFECHLDPTDTKRFGNAVARLYDLMEDDRGQCRFSDLPAPVRCEPPDNDEAPPSWRQQLVWVPWLGGEVFVTVRVEDASDCGSDE